MSILIKGMEMPKNEELIIICSDGTVEMTNNDGSRVCEQKAIELPPHGRLIDADALTNAIEDITWYHQNKNKDMVEGANSDEEQAWYREQDIYAAVDDAPTIIEADDSFFNSLKRGLKQGINGDVREMTIIEAEDDGYFTAEEQKLKWDVIYNKSQKTGININDFIEGKDGE